MKLLSRSEVLSVPEGVRVAHISRRRLGELLKRSRAKVAPLALTAASVRIKLPSCLRLEPVLRERAISLLLIRVCPRLPIICPVIRASEF
jgi:hypothetical protein